MRRALFMLFFVAGLVHAQYGMITKKDSLKFDATNFDTGHLCRVDTSYIAVVGEMANDKGWLKTVQISRSSGSIAPALADSSMFYGLAVNAPRIINVGGDKYAIFFNTQVTQDLKVKTLSISSAGIIGAEIDSLVIDANACAYMSQPYNIGSTYYLVAYKGVDSIRAAIVDIGTDGNIENSVVDAMNLYTDGNNGVTREGMCAGADSLWVLAFSGSGNDGHVLSVRDSLSHFLKYQRDDLLEYDTNNSYNMASIRIGSTNYYAVFYKTSGNPMGLATYEITADGAIAAAVTDSKIYGATGVNAISVEAVTGVDTLVAIAYDNALYDGWVKTYTLNADGTIGAGIDSTCWYAGGATTAPANGYLSYFDNQIYVLATEKSAGVAYVYTFEITGPTAPTGWAHKMNDTTPGNVNTVSGTNIKAVNTVQ